MRNPTIILRMTNSCNLNCTYCYDKKNHKSIISENKEIDSKIKEIVKNISKIQRDKQQQSKIIFHGGEPLLIRAEIYEKLIKEILKNNPNVKFSIQTNATLLNEDYIEIFKKYKVNIGISLDGYNEEQNKCRVYKNGKNSYDIVMKKINLLKEKDAKFGIIMTLSNGIIGHEQELYDFISSNKIGCNIRPAFLCENDKNDFVMTNEEFFCFFTKIFEIWFEDENKVGLTQIREIYEEFAKALNKKYIVKNCAVSENCFENFISLDMDGNLYSCNRTYNNKKLYYGNIKDIEMEELYDKMKEIVKRRKEYIKNSKCKECIIFNFCKGGCPANAYTKNGTIYSADDYFCEAKVNIYKYIRKRLEDAGYIAYYENYKTEGENI